MPYACRTAETQACPKRCYGSEDDGGVPQAATRFQLPRRGGFNRELQLKRCFQMHSCQTASTHGAVVSCYAMLNFDIAPFLLKVLRDKAAMAMVWLLLTA